MLRTLEWNEVFQSTPLPQTFQVGFFFLQHGIFCNAVTSSLLPPTRNLPYRDDNKKEKKRATPFGHYQCNLVDYSSIQNFEEWANKITLVTDSAWHFIYATHLISVRKCPWKKTPQLEFCEKMKPPEEHSLYKTWIWFKSPPLICPKRHQANQTVQAAKIYFPTKHRCQHFSKRYSAPTILLALP